MDPVAISFLSGDGQAELHGVWHPPTSRATNGAVIVLHGASYNKDLPPAPALCQGAARLGLTALRFNFRYVQSGQPAEFDRGEQGLDDLTGAIEFLHSFGKEIKPKRLYLIGRSLGAVVALRLAMQPQWAARISGVAALGLALYSPDRRHQYFPAGLPGLQSALLIVQGEHDPYATPHELEIFRAGLPVATRLEIIARAGHSFEPVGADHPRTIPGAANPPEMSQPVALTLDWLARQDAGREDLRK